MLCLWHSDMYANIGDHRHLHAALDHRQQILEACAKRQAAHVWDEMQGVRSSHICSVCS